MKDAPAGTEIWVKEGTYLASLSGNRSHSFDIGSGVKVFGGFAGNETVRDQRNPALHATILSGEIGNSGQATDNAYHVLNINPSAVFYSDSALLDGCRVEQGYANGTSGNSDGAGILVNSGTRVRMKTVTVAGNMAKGNGCGMKISSLAKVSLDSCRIENNDKITSYNGSYYNGTPGGGVYNAGKLAMAGCRVRFNDDDSEGGGIYNADSLVATGCRIDSNRQVTVRYAYGAGILNAGYALITGSTVNGNRITMYGGGIYNKTGGTLRVINTQISGNNGGWTGGGVMNEGTADLFNCDIRYNSVTTDGGGIYNKAGSVVTVCGSMIAFNTAAGAVSNTGGGGICNFGTLTINTSKICNNQTSGYGGGVYNPTWIRNSLIANNAKGGQFTTGGGVRVGAGCQGIEGSTIVNNSGQGIAATSIDNMGHEVPVADTADLFNCIVFGNDVQVTGNFNASDGCIEYGFTGTRILRDNPVFESPSGGKGPSFDGTMADWHTRPCSPCINRGNNTFLSTGDSLDAAGNSRVVETFVDLGGLEQTASQTHSINLNGNIVYVCDSAVEAGPGTSWANALSGNAPSCRYPGYSLLYEAIRDVPLSSSIWVKQGTYRACVDNDFRKFFEYGPGVKVFGGFSGSEQDLSHRIIETHPSIFTANVGNITDSTDNAFHVFYSYPSTTPWSDPALLDGLIIRDGYANYPENNGNTEKLIGAGIFNNTNARLEMRRCEVKNNYAFGKYAGNYYSGYTGGSGIYNKGTLLLKDCKVRHNINARSGAGIFSEAYLELRNSSVDSNRIQPAGTTYGYYWGGAGIYGDTGSTLVIDSCSLTRQSLPDDWAGAGIYCKGTLDLTNSSFESNRGTAVTSSGPATVYNCLFNGDGGGVLSSQSLTLLRCRFTNISFDTNYHAGCINVAGIAHIDSCEISHSNFAVVSSGKTRVSNTRICNNSNHTYVTSSPGGIFGFVFVIAGGTGTGIKHSGDTLWVENCDIGHNRAAGGAGICILSGTGFVNRSVIHHNMSDAGPALRNFGKLSVSNSIISNNSSNRYGTINLVAGSSTTITNSTIINNPVNTAFFQKTIYHGAHYDSAGSSAITLSNCVIKSVTAPLFASYTGSTGIDSVAYSCTSSPVPGTGNLTGDPMLIAPLSELDSSDLIVSHYTLSACSPCVNAGADSLCSDTLDLAGQLRKYNRIDMGALELKYDSSVIALWCSDIDSSSATVHWSRSVKPCATVVFIRDTVAGAPVPVPGTAYIANSTFGGGSIVDGWYCLYRGMDSTSSVTGLLPGTTYRVAVFNVILDSIYDTPALYNFTTPAALPLFKQVMNDTIDPGEANCYNATIALTVAGNGSRFRVASGGSATLISGQKIRLLPGTAVDPGGYLSAYISPDGPWCYQSKSRADIQPDNNPEMSEILKPAKPCAIRAWPNPVTGMLNVSWPPVDAGKPLSIKLFDIHSRRIFSTEVRSASQVACWMGDLPDGVYLIKAISEDSSGILRVIKK
ncbi:MAG TPA: T9SS type A sorting domain-containing protein [Bacteroidales bacterium]|nr:T9SS type A sorting domain-containing protein [Bacteroidales bacterium]